MYKHENFARSIFPAMAALKIVSKCGATQWQTVCKLRFFDDFCLAIMTKSSGAILNVSPEGVRHRDMPNKNLHRAKLSVAFFLKKIILTERSVK